MYSLLIAGQKEITTEQFPVPQRPYISSFYHSTAWHFSRSKLNLHNSKTPQTQLNSALIEADLYMPNSNFSIY
jgi:hypothetical protein